MTNPTRADAEAIARTAERELEALVAVSSRSGDAHAAEQVASICVALLPAEAVVERVPCSSPGHAPDLIACVRGRGRGRLLLLGHLDTVVPDERHVPLRRVEERLYGSGAVDMKGGVVLALGVTRWLAQRPERFAELAILLVVDEEWRSEPFAHVDRFAGYDACLCFEAGERTEDGLEGVVVRRKAAGALRIAAHGRAAHAGSAPDAGANALLALAEAARAAAALHDPRGPDALSVVPSVISAGDALNVVPARGELTIDVRAHALDAFDAVTDAIPGELDGVRLETALGRRWPGMDSRAATEPVLAAAGTRLGREIVGVARGGASDASHFAVAIPLTIDGLGPRGGGAHTPEEFVFAPSLLERAEVALAIVDAVLAEQ